MESIGRVDTAAENVLRVELWDHDFAGKDDFLGQLRLTGKGLDFLPAAPHTFALQPYDKLEWRAGLADGRLGRGYFAIVPPRSRFFM